MKSITTLVLIIVALLSFNCASAPPQLKETLTEVCNLYEQNRPTVVEFRTWAIAHKDQIPPEVWHSLEKLDAVLPLLDRRGADVCLLANASESFKEVGFDDLTAGLVKVIGLALQAKQAGAF